MKIFRTTLFIFVSLVLAGCSDDAPSSKIADTKTEKTTPAAESSEMKTPNKSSGLEMIWDIQDLNNPESVVYDNVNERFFISNVNGAPNEKDGNGYITNVFSDGTVLRKHWVIGLNAPKGLAIHDGTLYVADIDTLVAIDISSGSISNIYKVDDAKFFNDVAATSDGKIFVSDMAMNRIHCLCDGEFSIWLESPELENPNGLHIDGDNMIVAAWGVMTDGFATATPGHLKSVSLQNKSITSLGGKPIGNLDGIESDGHGAYFVTDWMVGKLYRINKAGEATLLLETEQGMADLEVVNSKNLMLIPLMMKNKLNAYKY